ncbi:uroporphyrinogen-III C-methyltransferase [Micromonospora sp. WMMD710]|uniref:uroporphyrinogen-III C-methyltransferase n=1 Tax=Micromonospora sp. WMMD710 TaxID=3016085 RepID=UPI00241699CC|nr:uroporphyrinogen-III C-methyltransferase [Micromonospora sp. WMMD710]MDG4757828.1 uroporphyrinogen-III C-methyltransferase [Micromonospora sp. WMMD710]
MTGLVIVGHGTRSAAGVDQFAALVERVRRRGDVADVEGGFIELSRPPLTDAVGALVARGHRAVVALPLVLTAAGHGKGDIPAAMGREQQRHPGLTYRYGRPLGPHPLLHDALEQRIDAALASADHTDTAQRAGTWVALIGRGSTDPDANAEVAKVARLLWEGRGYAGVEPGFISLAQPSVPAVLERLRRLGARRIVVAPYFLFAGVLPDRIVAQSAQFAAAHPDLDVRVAEVIGDCDALADLVLERYAEALGGDIRMNCDTCAYRVLMPGFADKVGRPQRPHDHPDDPVGHHHHHGHDHDHHHEHEHGSVAVVGGGPGPDDLITVRAKALLDAADVVVVDRLAPQGLLAGLRPDVLVIDAAKVPRGPSMSQDAINAALVAHARAGRRVVRLKGGDPYVFGRGHEEVLACRAAGVPVSVVPGVSSAIAAPALAGVPVTHRGVAHDVTIVSGHLPPGHPDSLVDWAALARARGTVVLLMAVDTIAKIAAELVEHGRAPDTPVLAVQDAGQPDQRSVPARLDEIGAVAAREGIGPPAVFVLGPVAALTSTGPTN